MKSVIHETRDIAKKYLAEFGFEKDQIDHMIATGQRDLEALLTTLDAQVKSEMTSAEDLDATLHALKGLLFQMGNHPLAEQIDALRDDQDPKVQLRMINGLL